jgi:ABC-type uncharacterized transport system auxiliary subunit
MKAFKSIAILLAVLTAAGCVKLWQENLDIRTYLLQTERTAPALESPLAEKLWIEPVHVLPPYNVRNLIVRKNDVEFAASYYSELLMSPAENFRSSFYSWLAECGVFGRVSVSERIGMTHSLNVSVMEFYVDEVQRKAVLKIRVTLLDETNRENRLLFSEDYAEEVAVEEANVDHAIRAYNSALETILEKTERDLINALQ